MSVAQSLPPTLPTVTVHPLVLLSIVDHYKRVSAGKGRRVVGILLGQQENNGTNVANSFAVPFEDEEKDPTIWFLDHNFLESMANMMKKVNAREKIIGWYHTGPKLRASDLAINNLIKRYTPNPTLVVVDVRPEIEGLPTNAYTSVEEITEDGAVTVTSFAHIPSQVLAEESEEIGVEQLLRDIKDLTALGSLSSRLSHTYQSLRALPDHLDDIANYIDQVVKGDLPVNHNISYLLQNAFNNAPKKEMGNKLNDEGVILYIASLVRAVTALHDLIDNKLSNKAEEKAKIQEEAKKKEEATAKKEEETKTKTSTEKTEL